MLQHATALIQEQRLFLCTKGTAVNYCIFGFGHICAPHAASCLAACILICQNSPSLFANLSIEPHSPEWQREWEQGLLPIDCLTRPPTNGKKNSNQMRVFSDLINFVNILYMSAHEYIHPRCEWYFSAKATPGLLPLFMRHSISLRPYTKFASDTPFLQIQYYIFTKHHGKHIFPIVYDRALSFLVRPLQSW